MRAELSAAKASLESSQAAMGELLRTNDDLSRRLEGLEASVRTQVGPRRARAGGRAGASGPDEAGRRAGEGQGDALTPAPRRAHRQERSKNAAESKAADTEEQMSAVAAEIMGLKNEMAFKEQAVQEAEERVARAEAAEAEAKAKAAEAEEKMEGQRKALAVKQNVGSSSGLAAGGGGGGGGHPWDKPMECGDPPPTPA